MNRVAVIVVTLAVLAGSVPVGAALADGTTQQPETEPGAAFAGVVGVQQAEVDSEVAQRSLDRQFAAAESNDSKARVVADQSERLTERLNELEAEKQRLEQARENGSIEQGEYKARLAALGAEIRAVERRANQTADVAEGLPDEALEAHGANVSEIRRVAQQAKQAGGGAVAEAARDIAGEGVGEGLRGALNGSERGPPSSVAGPNQNGTGEPGADVNTTRPQAGNSTGPGENAPPNATNATGGSGASDDRGSNASAGGDATAGENVTVDGNESTVTERRTNASGAGTNATAPATNQTGQSETTGQNETTKGQNGTTAGTPTDTLTDTPDGNETEDVSGTFLDGAETSPLVA